MALTIEALRRIAPKAKPDILLGILDPLNKWMPLYGVTSPQRQAHFLAQLAHESAGFKTMYEYASGAAYEGRRDLGNVQPGDGKRYKGRGLIQLTGRANYIHFGQKLGLDLVGNPDLAAHHETAVRVALEFWRARGLNKLADADDGQGTPEEKKKKEAAAIGGITLRINGGYNGLADRKAYLARAKQILNGEAPQPVPTPSPKPTVPAPKTTGTVAGGAAAGAAAKAAGFGWAETLGIAFAVAVVIVIAITIFKARGKE